MKVREPFLDLAYFTILIFLIAYGLLLVLRGYLGLTLSRLRRSPIARS